MKNIVVLVSGGGTNLQAIIDAIHTGKITNARISLVLSSREDAYALTRANENGIPAETVKRSDYPKGEAGRSDFSRALMAKIDQYNANLIVFGGFTYILSPEFIEHYRGRMINVHPALSPAFSGEGYYNLHMHEKALERGVKLTGATVHIVNEITDGGPIILQKAIEVLDDDTPQSLQKRVMEQCEWDILPKAIDLFCNDRLLISDTHVKIIK